MPSGMENDISQQQQIDTGERQEPQPYPAEHRKSGKRLGHTDRKRICNAGSKTAADRKKRHGNAGFCVPSKSDGERNHNGHQRYDFLKRAYQGPHCHKEEDKHSHQPILDSPKFRNEPVQHVVHQPVLS